MEDFEGLYRKYAALVFRFTLSRVGRKDLAEDITSEAFLELFRRWGQFDRKQLPAWLFVVAKNRAVDYWRHEVVEQSYAKDSSESQAPVQLPLESWMLEDKGLRPHHRICLILRYVHGMSRSEIASEVGLSETQVKGHLQYALKVLRKALKESSGCLGNPFSFACRHVASPRIPTRISSRPVLNLERVHSSQVTLP
jgi:RNA polymerase sigma-70 factor (ECF subfamily)